MYEGIAIFQCMLLLRPSELAGAILLRAMPPLAHPQPVKLDGMPVLIVSGARDPIIRPESAAKLASLLERYGAEVEHRVVPAGHELSQADVTLAQSWWNKQAPQ
jgi:phospholipase/carboxylesterase